MPRDVAFVDDQKEEAIAAHFGKKKSLPTAIRETASCESHMTETGAKKNLKPWERYSKMGELCAPCK